MPTVVLAPALARWLDGTGKLPSVEWRATVAGADVRDALDALFVQQPSLRGYVLDEHGRLRHHVAVFVDGEAVRDKATLRTAVRDGGEIYIMQALSGG